MHHNGTMLSPKRRRFTDEYLIDLNATQAAIRAGYSARTAEQQGSRLLRNVEVQAAIQQAQAARSERTGVTADYVVERLRDEAEHARSDAARVSALGLLGRHLGMFDDRLRIDSESVNVLRVEIGDMPTLDGERHLIDNGGRPVAISQSAGGQD